MDHARHSKITDDLTRRHAELAKRHGELAQQLLAATTSMVRNLSYAKDWRAIDSMIDELVVLASELAPLEVEIRQQQEERLREHRRAVAERMGEIEREKAEALAELRRRRDAEWGDRHVGVKGGFF